MFNDSRKIVLASLFVGAVAIAAYVSQSGKSWLSQDELGLEHDNASDHYTRGDTVTGSVISGPGVASSESAAVIAGKLQAARNSLQRNDLVTAQAQLDAVRSAHRDDAQVLVLQREVEARAKQAQHAPAAVHEEKPTRQGAKSARLSSPSSGKAGHAHERHLATREHSNRTSSSYAKTRLASETAVVAVGAASTPSGSASSVGASAVANSSSAVPAEVKAVSSAAIAPSASQQTQQTQQTSTTLPSVQARLTAQAAPAQETASAPQPAPAAGTLSKSEGGAETRAQVRAEVGRARADGSLPAFGNPDPAGPGGAPSRTGAPRP